MKRFCSVGLQADTLDSSMCPPEGGRYREQNLVAIPSLKSAPRIAGAFVMLRNKSTIGAILALVSCLLPAIPAHATTYYVAAAGSDSNNGTSTGTPWQTISKVNGSTFSAGDFVLFNRGDVWYGSSLTAPSSGSSGSPITFGAYGIGANPIIKGSTLLVTGGYTLAPNTQTTIFGRPDAGTNTVDGATRNWRDQFPVGEISNPAVKITIAMQAGPGSDLNITGSGIGPAATAPNTNAITRITWDGGSNGTTVPARTTKSSDAIVYTLDNTLAQIVTVYTTSRSIEYHQANGETLWSNFSAPDQSQNATVTGYSSGGLNVIASIVATNITAFTYRNTLGVTPVAVWENDALLKLAVNPLGVDQTAGSWYFDGTYLYLHATDGSNIASNGKAYSYVTASSPTYTTWDNAKSWLIFDSLDQAETYNTSSSTVGGLYFTGSNNIARNFSAHDQFRHLVSFYIGATNNAVTNVTAFNSYGTSPMTIYGSGTTGNIVQNSTFYNDTYLRSAYVFTGASWAVIVAHGGSQNNIVDSCVIYSVSGGYSLNTNVSHGYGLLVGDNTTSLTARHNLIYGNVEWGVDVGSGGNSSLTDGANITLWDNLIDVSLSNSSTTGGAGILLSGATSSIIYNNVVYGPLTTNAAVSQTNTSTGLLVKNNIFYTGAYTSVSTNSETGTVYDYNDYFSASGTPFSWGGAAYNFANWKTNSSQDAHSLNSDPKLTSGAGRNFTLLLGSPAIDAGTNLGSTYQLALSPSFSLPGGIVLLNQSSFGGGWEIGAYVFPANRSTLPLMGCCD